MPGFCCCCCCSSFLSLTLGIGSEGAGASERGSSASRSRARHASGGRVALTGRRRRRRSQSARSPASEPFPKRVSAAAVAAAAAGAAGRRSRRLRHRLPCPPVCPDTSPFSRCRGSPASLLAKGHVGLILLLRIGTGTASLQTNRQTLARALSLSLAGCSRNRVLMIASVASARQQRTVSKTSGLSPNTRLLRDSAPTAAATRRDATRAVKRELRPQSAFEEESESGSVSRVLTVRHVVVENSPFSFLSPSPAPHCRPQSYYYLLGRVV